MFDGVIEDLKDKAFNRVALQVWNPDAADDAGSYVVLRVKPEEVPALIEDAGMTYLPETRKVMQSYTMFATPQGSAGQGGYNITLRNGEKKSIEFPALAA
jgi:hypothetical protein